MTCWVCVRGSQKKNLLGLTGSRIDAACVGCASASGSVVNKVDTEMVIEEGGWIEVDSVRF